MRAWLCGWVERSQIVTLLLVLAFAVHSSEAAFDEDDGPIHRHARNKWNLHTLLGDILQTCLTNDKPSLRLR